jgi:tetratricopeptide (TPR) repeat protein
MQALGKGIELANRYTLVKKLGSGGTAQTWLARDRMTRASVALKVRISSAVSTAVFHREWQTSIRLMHAHIVRVFEYHDEAEPEFYSLQYVDGPDISILSGAPLEHILAPVSLVADALRYAHARDVVHRDIKAGNVLLDENGAPYLIDFGVAASKGEAAAGGSLIASSPQGLAGEPPHPADDIFALGGLVYELISGRSPYSSSDTVEDIRDRVPVPVCRPDGSAVPAQVRDLVTAMLSKDAAERPDAAAVVEQLAAAGFSGGPAPTSYVGKARTTAEEVIDVADKPRGRARPAASTALPATKSSDGLNPRVVGISLAVLLLLLVGVVFFLPDTVDEVAPQADVEATDVADEKTADQPGRSGVEFTENVDDLRGRDARVQARANTEEVLGELLSKMETLERRAVQRWGGLRFKQAQAVYADGDQAYLARDYALAAAKYQEAIEIVDPLLEQVDEVFDEALADGLAALEAGDPVEALRQLELAVAISSSDAAARAAFERAKNLATVLSLVEQGLEYEGNLEMEAARLSFSDAVELDPEWQPAQEGLARVLATIEQMEFDQRMTEGLMALGDKDYASARAAFRMAEKLKPGSPEPADGLLQVDLGIRLDRIASLERRAEAEKSAEQWETAIETYESILEIDGNLLFAQQGLVEAQRMSALHAELDGYIKAPDTLSAPSTMAKATRLVVDITRMPGIGPRLADERDQLSRLLKRAATPLTVRLVSDNLTDVSIYKIGKLGSFESRELSLRPGTYVAVGSRPGFRDVRLEFRVAPELDMQPVVVRCEEAI